MLFAGDKVVTSKLFDKVELDEEESKETQDIQMEDVEDTGSEVTSEVKSDVIPEVKSEVTEVKSKESKEEETKHRPKWVNPSLNISLLINACLELDWSNFLVDIYMFSVLFIPGEPPGERCLVLWLWV